MATDIQAFPQTDPIWGDSQQFRTLPCQL